MSTTSLAIHQEQSNASPFASEIERKLALRNAYYASHGLSLHDRKTLCAITGIKESTAEAFATRGGGPVYIKRGRHVLYRKIDIEKWLSQFPSCNSTADCEQIANGSI